MEGGCREVKLHSTRVKVILGTWKSLAIKHRKAVAEAKSAYFSVLFVGEQGSWMEETGEKTDQ